MVQRRLNLLSFMVFMLMAQILAVSSKEDRATAVAATAEEERLEDEYLRYYNRTDPKVHRAWPIMRTWWFGKEYDEMIKYCVEFHELAGKEQVNASIVLVQLNINMLRFRGKNNRQFARVDVCKYSENNTRINSDEEVFDESEPLYITNGLNSDCVYYLEPTDSTNLEFFLEAHVCRNATSDASTTTTAKTVTSEMTMVSSTMVTTTTNITPSINGTSTAPTTTTITPSSTSTPQTTSESPATSTSPGPTNAKNSTSKTRKASKSSAASSSPKPPGAKNSTSKAKKAAKSTGTSKKEKSTKLSKSTKTKMPEPTSSTLSSD